MTHQRRGQSSKWRIIDHEVFDRARISCSALPSASGDWLELHWETHMEALDLTNPGGVTYGTKGLGNDFFYLEYEGVAFAEATRINIKNFVRQYFVRADGTKEWI